MLLLLINDNINGLQMISSSKMKKRNKKKKSWNFIVPRIWKEYICECEREVRGKCVRNCIKSIGKKEKLNRVRLMCFQINAKGRIKVSRFFHLFNNPSPTKTNKRIRALKAISMSRRLFWFHFSRLQFSFSIIYFVVRKTDWKYVYFVCWLLWRWLR